jgi:hypothetical protein
MAVSINPKSEFRRVTSIQHGYGEVPVIQTPEGELGWGLPGKMITFCYEEATAMAKKLDQIIRSNLSDPNQLCK